MTAAFSKLSDFVEPIRRSSNIIRVHFNINDARRWVHATKNVLTTAIREEEVNSNLNAIHFSNLLRKNISSQKYMGSYAPLNDRYAMWKATYGRFKSGYWRLFGALLENISPTRLGKNKWLGGVRPGSKHPGGTSWFGKGDKTSGSTDLTQIGRFLEFGRKGQPARPIIAPTTEEYSSGQWVKEGESSLRKIANKWR